MEDVYAIEVDLGTGKAGIGADVVPERAVSARRLQHDRVGTALIGRGELGGRSLGFERLADEPAQQVLPHARAGEDGMLEPRKYAGHVPDASPHSDTQGTHLTQPAALDARDITELRGQVGADVADH
jgi:hypothetical protein